MPTNEPLRPMPNTSLEAAAEGYNEGYKEPGKSYWERNNDLLEEAYQRIGTLEDGSDTGFSGTVLNIAEDPYNAPEKGNGDATAAIQQAIDDLPQNGGTLFFPYMCRITSTLDATNRRNIRWSAAHGTSESESVHGFSETGGVYAETNGTPAIDTTGGIVPVFERGFAVTASKSSGNTQKPNIGILSARSQSRPAPGGPHFLGARVSGDFELAAIYNVSKELGVIQNSYLRNTKWNAPVLWHNADNTANVTSQFATIPNIQSCTQWHYSRSTFTGTHGPRIRFDGGTADHNFQTCYFYNNEGPAVLFEANNEDIHGPYMFMNCRMEGNTGGPFLKKVGPQELTGVYVFTGRPASGDGTLPPIDFNGNVKRFYYLDIMGKRSTGSAITVTDDLTNAVIQSTSGIDVDVGTLTSSNVELLNPDSTTTIGTIEGSVVKTQQTATQYRQSNHGGIVNFPPRSSPPTAPVIGDVVMQDGSGWNPTGSGQMELVAYDGTNWTSA